VSAPTRRSFLAGCAGAAATLATPPIAADGATEADEADPKGEAPTVFHVILHSPGETWQVGVGFRDQPGVMAHVEYMAGLLQAGTLAYGGPFLDDSGGMAVLKVADLADAERVAAADPSVQAGLLRTRVVPWMVAMSERG